MGSIISYNSDNMEGTASKARVAATGAGEAANKAGSGFNGLEIFFGSGTSVISQQLGAIQGSLDNVQGIVQRQTGAMFNKDAALGRAADMIEIPEDFVKNETNRFTQYHKELLEKMDGKSVNEGEGTRATKEMDESSIGEEKKMGDITTDKGADKQEYDATSGIGQEQSMADINKAGGDAKEEYDETSAISRQEEMNKLDTANGVEKQELNGNSVVTEEMLQNMTNAGGVEKQEVSTDSLINGQQTMGQLDTTNGLTRQELIDKSRNNAKQALENLSSGKENLGTSELDKAAASIKRSNEDKAENALNMLREDFKVSEAPTVRGEMISEFDKKLLQKAAEEALEKMKM